MAITLFLSLLIERVPTSTSILTCVVTPDFFQTWPFSTERRNSYFFVTPKCHYLVNVILWQIYIFIPLDPWLFLKVLNKVNFRAFTQTKVISYYWLIPVLLTKLLQLLAINHSLSERRIIFVTRLSKFFYVLVVL